MTQALVEEAATVALALFEAEQMQHDDDAGDDESDVRARHRDLVAELQRREQGG